MAEPYKQCLSSQKKKVARMLVSLLPIRHFNNDENRIVHQIFCCVPLLDLKNNGLLDLNNKSI